MSTPPSIFCPYCKQKTSITVAPAEYSGEYGGKFYTHATWVKFHDEKFYIGITNCCHDAVLVAVKKNKTIIYPSPMPEPTDKHIPDNIASDLDEAKICFVNECFRGCAVMARRAIQNACIAKGAKKDKLQHQIDELFELNKITKDLKDFAHTVRLVGNDAAHPDEISVEKDEAEDILELAKQFLQVLFVTPAIAAERMKKRSEK